MPRQLLLILVYAIPFLTVGFSVLMGGYLLLRALGDATGASVFHAIAIGCVVLLATDFILLLAALGFDSLTRSEDRDEDSQ